MTQCKQDVAELERGDPHSLDKKNIVKYNSKALWGHQKLLEAKTKMEIGVLVNCLAAWTQFWEHSTSSNSI